jgi:hypothetical protein
MSNTQATETADHRIFGFTELGQLRANLYHGAGLPYAGTRYSWVVAPSERSLTNKLAEQWEQPLSEEEWETLEALQGEAIEVTCNDCDGRGVDPGGLSAYEPEDCRSCGGSGRETVPALVGFGNPASAPRIALIGNGLYVRTRKAVA